MGANSGAASGERLDELYREHPGGFVAARNRLVKELRAAGDRDEAGRLAKLRRPTVAAWLINRAALESPAKLEEFAAASLELERAQGRALEGRDQGAAHLRAAAAREREASGAVVDLAERLARDAGHPASEPALELVAETLRAATGDPELRERLLRGRVDREQSAATLGTPAAAPPKTHDTGSAKRRASAEARRELERLERELSGASAHEERLREQVARSAEVLREERSELAASERQTKDLRRQVKAAARRARA
jgi:hypothetical protein